MIYLILLLICLQSVVGFAFVSMCDRMLFVISICAIETFLYLINKRDCEQQARRKPNSATINLTTNSKAFADVLVRIRSHHLTSKQTNTQINKQTKQNETEQNQTIASDWVWIISTLEFVLWKFHVSDRDTERVGEKDTQFAQKPNEKLNNFHIVCKMENYN